MVGSEEELQDLTGRLASTSKSYGMEISTEKSKLLVTGASGGLSGSIAIDGKQLEQVGEFKYLDSTITDDQRSTQEVRSRIAAASAAVARLVTIWRDRNISIGSKLRLLNAIVLSIFLYACQSWTLTAEFVKKIEAFELRSYRRLLRIPFTDHRTDVSVREEINSIHKQIPLIVSVRRRKSQFFGHIVRSGCLSLTVLQGCVAGGRGRDRTRMSWLDNIISWTALDVQSLLAAAGYRFLWRSLDLTCSVTPRRP